MGTIQKLPPQVASSIYGTSKYGPNWIFALSLKGRHAIYREHIELWRGKLIFATAILGIGRGMSLLKAFPCPGFTLKEACQLRSHPQGKVFLRHAERGRNGGHGGHRHHVAIAGGLGGGVLDRPTTKGLPGMDPGKSTTKQRPRSYRVMLHNDDFNRREYVVKVLLKVLDNFTMEDAINCMQEAHTNGVACLVSCPQEDAERYCEGLRGNGLISSIEPAGGSGSGPEAS